MKSMTGYAKTEGMINNKKIIIEIKTLNSKQIDAAVKLPARYKSHEIDIRSLLTPLGRGKIDFLLTEENSSSTNAQLNIGLIEQRLAILHRFTSEQEVKIDDRDLLQSILQQEDVWSGEENDSISDNEWQQLTTLIQQCVKDVDTTRSHEGSILEQDFIKHVDLIEECLQLIPRYEEERIANVKEKLRNALSELKAQVDENRFEQELIYYLEKLDITEEKVRLAKHIAYFREVMRNEEGSGRKLGFIAQEMGREINTTGSKANNVDIQKLVVKMKDELEKIKEQLGNIL